MVQGMGLGHRVYYAIFDKAPKGERPIAWLILKQRPGWWAWEVEQLMVFPQFRRQGLASKLYKAVINHDRCMLASGKTHTSHSKAMWESFIRQDLFNVWAHDFSDLQNFYQVCWDKESQEVVSQLSLYSPTYTRDKISKNNVRLVAMRKG
jgi:GNAT superfamily N-acetyltransferase